MPSYLMVDEMPGEHKVEASSGLHLIDSLHWGYSIATSNMMMSGRARGSTLSFKRKVDVTSPDFFLAGLQRRSFELWKIYFHRTGSTGQSNYFLIAAYNVHITSYEVDDLGDIPIETIGISYTQIGITAWRFDTDLTSVPNYASYDFAGEE